MAEKLVPGGFLGPSLFGSNASNDPVADWPLDIVRYYGVDPVNGDDARPGFVDAAPGANLGVTLLNRAWRTLEHFYLNFPLVGAGRMVVVMLGRNTAGALLPWNAGVPEGHIDLSGVSGYRRGPIVRGTEDFTNSITDKILLGFIPGALGPNPDGSFTVQGVAGNVVTVVAGVLPTMPLALTYRAHVVGDLDFPIVVSTNPGASEITFEDASTFQPNDTFWLEIPGVTIARYRECIDRAQDYELSNQQPLDESALNFGSPSGGLVGVQIQANRFAVGSSLLGCGDGASGSFYCGLRDDFTFSAPNQSMLTNPAAGPILLGRFWIDETATVIDPGARTCLQSLNWQFGQPFGQGTVRDTIPDRLPMVARVYTNGFVQVFDTANPGLDVSNPPPFFVASSERTILQNSTIFVGLLDGAPDEMSLRNVRTTCLALRAAGRSSISGVTYLPGYPTSFGLFLLGTSAYNGPTPAATQGSATHYALRNVTGTVDAAFLPFFPSSNGYAIYTAGSGFTIETDATVTLVNSVTTYSWRFQVTASPLGADIAVTVSHADLAKTGFITPNQVRVLVKGRPCPEVFVAAASVAVVGGQLVMMDAGTGQLSPALADTAGHASSLVGVACNSTVPFAPLNVFYANGTFVNAQGAAAATAGVPLYLSDAVPGAFTTVAPAVVLPLGVSITATDGATQALVAWRADVVPDFAMSAQTLDLVYASGAAAPQQTMVILDAKGGGVAINATTPGLAAVTAFEINVIGGSFNFYTAGGFDVSSARVLTAPLAGSAWNANAFLAATLTLTAGGVAPTALSCTTFAIPVITQTVGVGYVVPIAATLTILGAPIASNAGGQSPTLSNTIALNVQAGNLRVGAGAFAVANGAATDLTLINTDYSISDTPLLVQYNTTTSFGSAIFGTGPNNAGPTLNFIKGRSATGAAATIVQNGDILGILTFVGTNGVDTYSGQGAYIQASVDGAPALNSMPTTLTFGTASVGSVVPTARMMITAGGNVIIGTTSDVASSRLRVLASKSVVAAAGAVWNGIDFAASTLTLTGAVTPVTGLSFFNVAGPTITAASAVVTTDFYTANIGKAIFGAGVGPSSATRQWALGLADSIQLRSGNLVLGTGIAAGANANLTLALHNGATAPGASADLCHLYSADIAAGRATLAIYAEEAVAADVGLASTHSFIVFIGGAKYKMMLVSVP